MSVTTKSPIIGATDDLEKFTKLFFNNKDNEDWLNEEVRGSKMNVFYSLETISHYCAWNNGWWTNVKTGLPQERNVLEALALIHSEISESFDAFNADSIDDHLTNRKGFEVELADTIIRVFDLSATLWVGAIFVNIHKYRTDEVDTEHLYLLAHSATSEAVESTRKGASPIEALSKLLAIIFDIACAENCDLGGAIIEKLLYNNNRADHKLENRAKTGGKAA